jgi:hypothetical protein
MLAEANFLRTKAEPRLVSHAVLSVQFDPHSLSGQFYKPWELRPEEVEQIRLQIEEAGKSIEMDVDEHRTTAADEKKDKVDEVRHPHPSASQVDGAEPLTQPEHAEVAVHQNEQPKTEVVAEVVANSVADAVADSVVEAVGIVITDDQQATMEKDVPDVDTANHEEEKPEARDKAAEAERKRAEEKPNEDHGGEELVEGQEDDVMY